MSELFASAAESSSRAASRKPGHGLAPSWTWRSRWKPLSGAALIVLALALLGLNASAWLLPPRHPVAAGRLPLGNNQRLPLDYGETLQRIASADREDGFAARVAALTAAVHDGMLHLPFEQSENDPYLQVYPRKNYLLHLLGYLDPLFAQLGYGAHTFGQYEFLDPYSALERGVGECSQASMALSALLGERGIDAEVVALSGHIVTAARAADGREVLLDADKGVVLPFGLAHAEAHPQDVARGYREAGRNPKLAAWAADVYGPEGNQRAGNPRVHRPKLYWIEHGSAVLRWLLPLALLAYGARWVRAAR